MNYFNTEREAEDYAEDMTIANQKTYYVGYSRADMKYVVTEDVDKVGYLLSTFDK